MEEFKTVNGVLTDYSGNKTEIVIPDGVKKIDCAFILHSKSHKVRHMQGGNVLKASPEVTVFVARRADTGAWTGDWNVYEDGAVPLRVKVVAQG